MTAETDLLPLPEPTGNQIVMRGDDFQCDYNFYVSAFTGDQLEAYARANVARAVAPLQAEVEALRAEVEEWKDVARCASEQQDSLFREACALNEIADNLRAEVHFRDSVIATHAADTREYQKRISQAEARAERLAEALRGWWEAHRPVGWTEDHHRSCPHVNLATDAEKALATARLRDQEE